MRKYVFLLLIVAAIVVGGALYLMMTTPRSTRGIRVPLTTAERELLAAVPADADAFALIPSAAALRGKLRANRVTREAVEVWTTERNIPRPWMLGGADLVIWQSKAGTTYGFRLDPFRALLLRTYVLVARADVTVNGRMFFVGPPPTATIGSSDLSVIDRANGLAGDAIVVQRGDAQMFPPVSRPAVSVVSVSEKGIDIVSRAPADDRERLPAANVTLPRNAILSAWFGDPPRVIADVDRLLPGDISALLRDGGSIVIYDVEARRLLPRPKGLIVVADSAEAREATRRLSSMAELVGEVAYRDGHALIALDRTSLGAYTAEQFSEVAFPANRWAVRLDTKRMVPLLERLGDNVGLRFAAPRLYRSIRDLRRWIRHLGHADTIEAALSSGPAGEELRVRIASK